MFHPRKMKLSIGLISMLSISPSPSWAGDYLRGIAQPPPNYPASSSYPASSNYPAASEVDWTGFYGGFFVGGGSSTISPKANASRLAQEALPQHALTSSVATLIRFKDTTNSRVLSGAFVGYNVLWDDVVLGVEADFSNSSFAGKSASSDTRSFPTTSTSGTGSTGSYVAKIDSSGEASLSNWATIRGRVGWAAGNFMPFMTGGLALANLKSDYSSTVTVQEYLTTTSTTNCGQTVCTSTQLVGTTGPSTGSIKHTGIAYGIAFGAGVDFAFMHNFFVRGEWQYVQFGADGKKPDITINTARVAGAMKF